MREDDKQIIDQLVHDPDMADHSDEVRKILEFSDQWQTPEGKSEEEAWNLLDAKLSTKGSGFSKTYIWLSAAAVALLIVAFGVFLSKPDTEAYQTLTAQSKVITLPDGSEVALNAESELKFSADNNGDRQIELIGEAFFKVNPESETPGSIFAVKSGNMITEVLGTSFNIYARDNEYTVECVSGTVRVSDGNNEIILVKNERVSAISSVLGQKEVLAERSLSSWMNGQFQYTNASLNKVVNEFERQYGVEVQGEIELFETKRYTGRFNNKDIESAARQVFEPMGYSFKIQNKKVIIKTN